VYESHAYPVEQEGAGTTHSNCAHGARIHMISGLSTHVCPVGQAVLAAQLTATQESKIVSYSYPGVQDGGAGSHFPVFGLQA